MNYKLSDRYTEHNLAVLEKDGRYTATRYDSGETVLQVNFENFLMVTPETLILIAIDRLEKVNAGPERCRETSLEITKLEEALLWAKGRELAKSHSSGPYTDALTQKA